MTLKLYENKGNIEVGVDEVGRGCLFGRVYSASVIMPYDYNDEIYLEIKDSKKLSRVKREKLSQYIKDNAIDYSVSYVSEKVIDKINIYNATIEAMHKSINGLNMSVDTILVDGPSFKPYMNNDDEFISHICVPKGDNTYLSIAAASILAKVERDNYIKNLVDNDNSLKKYHLEDNKGYGTKHHLNAIREFGITSFHRKTFGICKNYK